MTSITPPPPRPFTDYSVQVVIQVFYSITGPLLPLKNGPSVHPLIHMKITVVHPAHYRETE